MVDSIARVKHIRVTPQKARRVVALIKGKQAQEALAILKFAPTRTFRGHIKDDRRSRRG